MGLEGASNGLLRIYNNSNHDPEIFIKKLSKPKNHTFLVELFENLNNNPSFVKKNPNLIAKLWEKMDAQDLRNLSPEMLDGYKILKASGILSLNPTPASKLFVFRSNGKEYPVDVRNLMIYSRIIREQVLSERAEAVQWKETVLGEMEIKDFSEQVVQYVIDFLNNKNTSFPNEKLIEILALSSFLDIEELTSMVENKLLVLLKEEWKNKGDIKVIEKQYRAVAKQFGLQKLLSETEKIIQKYQQHYLSKKPIPKRSLKVSQKGDMSKINKNTESIHVEMSLLTDENDKPIIRWYIDKTIPTNLLALTLVNESFAGMSYLNLMGESLRKLVINSHGWGPTDYDYGLNKVLSRLIDNCPNLEILDLRIKGLELNSSMIEQIAELRELEEINLGGLKIDSKTFEHEIDRLLGLPHLRKLTFPKKFEAVEDVSSIARAKIPVLIYAFKKKGIEVHFA